MTGPHQILTLTCQVLEQSKDAKANTGAKERKSMGTKGVEGNARAASAPAPRGVKIAPAGKTAKDPKPQNLHKDTSKAKRKPSRKPKEPEAAGVSQPKQPGPVSSAQTLLMPSSWGNFETADLEFRQAVRALRCMFVSDCGELWGPCK